MKASILLLTHLPAKRCAKSLLRLAGILAATVCVGSFLAPTVRCTALSDSWPSEDTKAGAPETTNLAIPGPLRSFLRMAGISQKVSPEEVMPLLARNVYILGYQGQFPKGRPSEFLILLTRYVQQARELTAIAGPDGVIHVSNCDEAKPLLKILGIELGPIAGSAALF